jgi:hypothetical protein
VDLDFKLCTITGLPRTGSTLLSAIFNQHESVHIESSSALSLILMNFYADIYEESTSTNVYLRSGNRLEKTVSSLVPAIINGFYKGVEKPVVIDKSRGWTIPIVSDNVVKHARQDIKFLVLVRPIEEIITSFAGLVEEEERTEEFYRSFFNANSPIMAPLTDILKMDRNQKENVLFKEYEDLISNPVSFVSEVSDFFELPDFNYSFDNLSSYKKENDEVHEENSPYKNLHTLRNGVYKRKNNFKIPSWVKEQSEQISFFFKDFASVDFGGGYNGTFC